MYQVVPGRYGTLGISVFSSLPLAERTCQTPVTLAPLPILDLLTLHDPLYRVVRARLRMTSLRAVTSESPSKEGCARLSPASSSFVDSLLANQHLSLPENILYLYRIRIRSQLRLIVEHNFVWDRKEIRKNKCALMATSYTISGFFKISLGWYNNFHFKQ